LNETIRVLIVDDHPVVRRGLHALLKERYGIEVVGEAGDGQEAIEKAHSLSPNVILMDLVMPNKDGIQAIREIRINNPQSRVIVLTSFIEDEKIILAIKAGAVGFILKDSSPQELIDTIYEVHRGNTVLPPSVTRVLIKSYQRHPLVDDKDLTPSETEVLRCISQGMSNKEIALRLNISQNTVRFHISGILTKLNLENRTQAAMYAMREGLV
jgi:NarL family two-component system response regulator LiaR